jgi:hypothetical protein
MLSKFRQKTWAAAVIIPYFCMANGLATQASSQDAVMLVPQAYLALGAIEADIVELSRIADYQAELIDLAREDVEAALSARRHPSGCAQRAQVKSLCTALAKSFPEAMDVK